MQAEQLKARFKKFALDIVHFTTSLPTSRAFQIYSHQLIRSSSSMGANYRAACRGKSTPDFINKLKIVEEETDESVYFLELIEALLPGDKVECERLIREGTELLKIIVASIMTAKNINKKTGS